MHHFDVDVANDVGVTAAIVFDGILHRVATNIGMGINERDGRFWTYQSIKGLQEIYTYYGAKSLRNGIARLIEKQYILKGEYNQKNYDKTTWYALDKLGLSHLPKRQMVIAQRANGFSQKGEPIPLFSDIPKGTSSNKIDHSDICKQVMEAYNSMAKRTGLPRCNKITAKRKSYILARYRESKSIDPLMDVLSRVENTPFLLGDNNRGWMADIEFIYRESGFTQIYEGKYASKGGKNVKRAKSRDRQARDVFDQAGDELLADLEENGFTGTSFSVDRTGEGLDINTPQGNMRSMAIGSDHDASTVAKIGQG